MNFYKFHSRDRLEKEEYAPLFDKLDEVEYTNDLEPIAHILKKDSWHAYLYASYVIKDRWVEAEPIIMIDPQSAYYYATTIMDERWLEAEDVIRANLYWGSQYRRYFEI